MGLPRCSRAAQAHTCSCSTDACKLTPEELTENRAAGQGGGLHPFRRRVRREQTPACLRTYCVVHGIMQHGHACIMAVEL